MKLFHNPVDNTMNYSLNADTPGIPFPFLSIFTLDFNAILERANKKIVQYVVNRQEYPDFDTLYNVIRVELVKELRILVETFEKDLTSVTKNKS